MLVDVGLGSVEGIFGFREDTAVGQHVGHKGKAVALLKQTVDTVVAGHSHCSLTAGIRGVLASSNM